MAASESALGGLHALVAELLAERLRTGEASASDFANAIKFLKDNSITADVDENDKLKELKEQLGKTEKPDEMDLSAALDQLQFTGGLAN